MRFYKILMRVKFASRELQDGMERAGGEGSLALPALGKLTTGLEKLRVNWGAGTLRSWGNNAGLAERPARTRGTAG